MIPKVIGDYGGPFVDRGVVRDPTWQQGADKGNRVFEDLAQLTRTGARAIVSFPLSAGGAGTISAGSVSHTSMWGPGSTEKPTVAKVSTGTYTITWAPSFDDALSVTENVVFTYALGKPNVRGATNGHARISSIVSNVVTVLVYDDAAPGALSDLGGSATLIDFAVR